MKPEYLNPFKSVDELRSEITLIYAARDTVLGLLSRHQKPDEFDAEQCYEGISSAYEVYYESMVSDRLRPSFGAAKDELNSILSTVSKLRGQLGLVKGEIREPKKDMHQWTLLAIAKASNKFAVSRAFSDLFVGEFGQNALLGKTYNVDKAVIDALAALPTIELILSEFIDSGLAEVSEKRTGRRANEPVRQSILWFVTVILQGHFELQLVDSIDAAGEPCGVLYDELVHFFEPIDKELANDRERLRNYIRTLVKSGEIKLA